MFLRKLLSWKSNNEVLPFAKMATSSGNANWKSAKSIYDFSAIDIDGNEVSLEKYRGHVAIIVNVASNNQFGGQEPGTEAQIKEFVKQYNVSFDMFSKINVNGDNTHPLWSYLKNKQGGTLGNFIKWNFSKFLIDKNGQPVKRYAPNVEPNALEPDLLKYFAE
ncbi:hypothetical protein JTE90_010145 [Oedothorax gibbosus]|uniref:Glutathione peroxidase n=1 Tax=Oedothorax gibbosus TaxID=931172 RepID=A0AAV6UJ15_9ARAC|nr:hypothetical protein JTE90_010145 [Oedothorax gibbosus]